MAHVLLVEDNPANSKLALLLLHNDGHVATLAEDALSAIRIAQESQPDLILMDIQLAGMDGHAATQRLKTDSRTRHIRVVAFTAHAMKSDAARLLESGFDGCISKPFHYKDFLRAVRTHLEAAGARPDAVGAGSAA